MTRKCENCNYWLEEVCVNGSSDQRADFTDPNFSCKHHEWDNECVRVATSILREELLKRDAVCNAFQASVLSAINESESDTNEQLAKRIADRVIGIGD